MDVVLIMAVRVLYVSPLETSTSNVGNDLLWDSFYLFHGSFRFPVEKYTVDEIRHSPPKPPIVGACVARDFPAVREAYPNAEVQFSQAQFICWQVSTGETSTPP